jgi:L-lactate dehydrogenase complex protein LldG
MNRNAFLANVRHSLKLGYLPDADSQAPAVQSLSSFNPYDLATQFTERALATKSEVHQVSSHTASCQRVCDILTKNQATRFMSWRDEFLPIQGLNVELVQRGFQCQDDMIPNEPANRREAQIALSDVTVGLTGAMAGLADTGSLVVSCGDGRGRLASLLPPIHIALLETRLLFPTIAHFVQAHPDAARRTSNLVFITGPSRSADIEQTMTLGIHGPKELHVILMAQDPNKTDVQPLHTSI